ncbi:CD209 antigen-like protein E [Alosa sapidissima]|uniref:CD209 antigen-like protein E n=1 Tax=Alosa sapidissima TaxID=34773 RepID=UPI001C08D836|nr:CD209 antigen-like protein E [Alosa sapidissima]
MSLKTGWKYFRSSIYFFSTVRKTWYEAREDSKQRGADLVIINSKEEQTFLSVRRTEGWIGLTDREREGVWRWVDGTPLTRRYWWSGQPNDYQGNQDCARLYNTKWDDKPCSTHYVWTCEKQVKF